MRQVPPRYGVFSKPTDGTARLRDGDRVEVYRPLLVDPKQARRERANARRE
jgi:putative ubiquitin-RnfH superfamily antitoxin RatB of RatAB toxin-antitoxin module